MNESSSQAPPEEPNAASSGLEPTAAAEAPAAPVPPPEAPAVVQEPPIAPGVERLGRPAGTAKGIPETILGPRPSPVFLAVVSIASLAADIGTKLWAEKRLADYPG